MMSDLTSSTMTFPGRGYDSRIERLRHITGFITVYGGESDPRVSVFARLWHVERVALVTRLMSGITDIGEVDRVEKLVWRHDLNRWPFAHNGERGLFDQAANVAEYFSGDADLAHRDVLDLRGIHEKDPASLSHEGRIVLFADALTGSVEDILFAVAGLNLHPRLIPGEVENLLGFSLQDGQWYAKCERLARKLHGEDDPQVAAFQEELEYVFSSLVKIFLDRHSLDELHSGCLELFGITDYIKSNFIRPVIFPVNNEKVCHSSWLRYEVMPWYLTHVEDARQRLLKIDEREFVADIVARESPFEAHQFLADIEYVSRETPSLAFVK
jgi:hypothetical protein